ncbi:MAG: hypothetical protein N2651_01475, partial [Fimbriimonadales bacterium]|nr:hypothetical protein [Fimbriimonadales bacterium]
SGNVSISALSETFARESEMLRKRVALLRKMAHSTNGSFHFEAVPFWAETVPFREIAQRILLFRGKFGQFSSQTSRNL